MGHKRALLVGINYPGTSSELRGCVNDVIMTEETLRDHYGFNDIGILLNDQATTANIKNKLQWLIKDAKPGDILFFHYSGHGSQVLDTNDPDFEPDGLDEILCPIDLDWNTRVIKDDDLKHVFDSVPDGVLVTAVLDCCHSGGGIDHNNQYQPQGVADRSGIQQLGGRYLLPPPHIQQKAKTVNYNVRSQISRNVNKNCLLISGCQSHQTSADAFIDGKYVGACSYMINKCLTQFDFDLTYKTLVEDINHKLSDRGFTQRPELNGPSQLFLHKFLQPLTDNVVVPDQQSTTDVQPTQPSIEPLEVDDNKNKNKVAYILIGLGVLAVVGIMLFNMM